MAKYKGRLELNWVNKGDIIISKIFPKEDKARPLSYLNGEFDAEELLPRELELLKTIKRKKSDPEPENLLIWGENLIALKSIEKEFAGKIKLIYIDPPFNTGQDFKDYEDGLEHSIWLSIMKNRLEIAEKLLHPKGAIFVEIDDSEYARLKLLMDEIFRPANYIATITIKRSAATGHKAINPGTINVSEHILIYAKDKPQWEYKRLFVLREEYDAQYRFYIENRNKGYKKWRFVSLADKVATTMNYPNAKEARKAVGKQKFLEEYIKFALDNSEKVIRFAIPDYESVSKGARILIDKSKMNDEIQLLKRKDYDDMYFYKGDRILFLSNKVKPIDETEGIVEPLTNFWDDISWQGIASEGGVTLKKGKKPEKLLKRILELANVQKGDWVLDCYAGSGTTGAVAHKMRINWIMIELKEGTVKTKAFKRLENVVKGESGVVGKSLGWTGGGGFKFYKLGEPLIVKHKDYPTIKIMNPRYYNGALIKVICKLEGFSFKDDPIIHGANKLGNKYIHITEQYVSQAYVDYLKTHISEGEELLLYCFKHDEQITVPDNIIVKRLPDDLLKNYAIARKK